jgi:hypothetical protein
MDATCSVRRFPSVFATGPHRPMRRAINRDCRYRAGPTSRARDLRYGGASGILLSVTAIRASIPSRTSLRHGLLILAGAHHAHSPRGGILAPLPVCRGALHSYASLRRLDRLREDDARLQSAGMIICIRSDHCWVRVTLLEL